ncbi:VRR-NUC domain-containing protein [Nonomuraea sp. NPDC005650]|uniref:VRR-NUC domain-containing protein n=1 Tax=Nonomuraea sp. NPDC005650 TaxID=3157045 RepID=UPI0033B977AE
MANLLDAMTDRLNRMPEEAQKKLIRTMTEATLRDLHIKPRAKALGWLLYWTWNSRNSPAGFPDIILLHPVTGALVVRELKMYGKKPRSEQQAWLDAYVLAGVDAGVWTPEHLFNGEIDRVMIGGARRPPGTR